MSDAEQTPDDAPTAKKSSPQPKRSASATARIIRETDMMRSGLDAVVRGVTPTELVVEGSPGLKVQDQIKIHLRHVVQRFEKEVRGLVRKVEPLDAESERVTVELFTRLTPVEVGVLKMGIDASDGSEPRWV
jgi:hypothetical protein